MHSIDHLKFDSDDDRTRIDRKRADHLADHTFYGYQICSSFLWLSEFQRTIQMKMAGEKNGQEQMNVQLKLQLTYECKDCDFDHAAYLSMNQRY